MINLSHLKYEYIFKYWTYWIHIELIEILQNMMQWLQLLNVITSKRRLVLFFKIISPSLIDLISFGIIFCLTTEWTHFEMNQLYHAIKQLLRYHLSHLPEVINFDSYFSKQKWVIGFCISLKGWRITILGMETSIKHKLE